MDLPIVAALLGLTGAIAGWQLCSLATTLCHRWELINCDSPAPLLGPRAQRLVCAVALAGSWSVAAYVYGVDYRLPVSLAILLWLALVSAIDIQTHFIPDRLTYPAIMAAPLFLWLWPDATVFGNVLSGVLVATFFALVHLLNRQGLGFGDVKLALVLGLYLGPWLTVVAVGATVVLGGLAGMAALVAGLGRKALIPYGPMLAAGGALAHLGGRALIAAYSGAAP